MVFLNTDENRPSCDGIREAAGFSVIPMAFGWGLPGGHSGMFFDNEY